MSIAKIRSALIQAYMDCSLGLPTQYPNMQYQPTGGTWVSLSIINGRAFPATLGNGGADELRGILQISIHMEPNTGDGFYYNAVDTLRAKFIAGKAFTFDGTWVRVTSTSPRTTFYNPPYTTGVVEVEWESRINRNLIIT